MVVKGLSTLTGIDKLQELKVDPSLILFDGAAAADSGQPNCRDNILPAGLCDKS